MRSLTILPRVFLFKHPGSCAELREIAQHPIFSKYIDTLVVYFSPLKSYRTISDRIEDSQQLRRFYPTCQAFFRHYYRTSAGSELLLARVDYEEAVGQATGRLEKLYGDQWKAHQALAAIQSTAEFQKHFSETITRLLEVCPNLHNLVAASGQLLDSVQDKRRHLFGTVPSDHESWESAHSSSSADLGFWDMIQAKSSSNVRLNSMTILNAPFRYMHGPTPGLYENLKHIRITQDAYVRALNFTLNLERLLTIAHSLETLWLMMDNRPFYVDGILHAIKSKRLRDLMLFSVYTSEDSLVELLLRHSQSLQQLDLGCVFLHSGSWASLSRRISCKMEALSRIQLIGIGRRSKTFTENDLTPTWSAEAQTFILRGGDLPEPRYDNDEDRRGSEEYSGPGRDRTITEVGLWSDYDGLVNPLF